MKKWTSKKWACLYVLTLPAVFALFAFFAIASVCAELSKPISSEGDWMYALHVMSSVESGWSADAVGDTNLQNKAYGIVQIRKPYLLDALEWATWNEGKDIHADALLLWDQKLNGLTPEKLKGAHPTVSFVVVRCYMKRWATEKRVGGTPTLEDILRIHNGGGPRYGDRDWIKSTDHQILRATRFLLCRKMM